MKVKRYEASSMQEAITMVKAEMGRDAVILHSKKIRKGGIFGVFGKSAFEVIAAISPEDQAQPEPEIAVPTRPVRDVAPRREPAAARDLVVTKSSEQHEIASLQQEILGMKEILTTLNTSLINAPIFANGLPSHVEGLYTLLLTQGVADKYIKELLSQVAPKGTSEDEIIHQAKSCITDTLTVAASVEPKTTPKVFALIGPTGVGKTTTIAKLAAQYALFDGLDVGLVTADTYRIAAVEQLKTYAEIIGVPLEVVFSVEEIREAKEKLAHKDVILVDTAGRSPKNTEQLTELQAYLSAADPTDVALVLSATTQPMGLVDCLQRFKPCQYNQLIFTKLDEASVFGALYNTLRETSLPLTYLTFGQTVPDDIRPGEPEYVAQLLLSAGGKNCYEPYRA